MRSVWIVGSVVGVATGCFDGLTLEPPGEDQALTITAQPSSSMEEIYAAIELQNLTTPSGTTTFFVGSEIDFGFDFVSHSRKPLVVPFNDVYGAYAIGVEQSWIARLGADPTLPFPTGYARKGDWYAAGGSVLYADDVLDSRHRLRFGTKLATASSLATADFPPGSYRYIVEYKRLGSGIYDGVLHTAQIDFTLNEAPNYVFVTSTTYSANLGGLAGADAVCQARAEAGGLPGTYRAYLSTDTVDAIDRLGSARGWWRPDKQLVADTPAALAAGTTYHPIRIDELGNDVGTAHVFTATSEGTRPSTSSSCVNWTSTDCSPMVFAGNSAGEGNGFSGFYVMYNKDYPPTTGPVAHLYCFAVDKTVAVAPTPVLGRVVFVSNAPWTPGGGLAAADAICQADGQNAGLSGTFRAALAANGTTVMSRFDTSGPTWVRPDGMAVAPTAADFFAAPLYDSAPNVTANGAHLGNWGSWTGASSLSATGTDASTCSSWTTSIASNAALFGFVDTTDTFWRYSLQEIACDATWMRLTCLQL